MRVSFMVYFAAIGTAVAAMLVACSWHQPRGASQRPGRLQAAVPMTRPIRASQLMQTVVNSGDGESLGKIEDLVLDPSSGRVVAVLVSKPLMVRKGEVMGVGEIVVPVSWDAIRIGAERRFVVSVDEQRLAEHPQPQAAGDGSGYEVHIYGFLQAEPPSGLGGTGGGDVETGHGESQSEATHPSGLGIKPNEL